MKVFALENASLDASLQGLTGTAFLTRFLSALFTWLIVIAVVFFVITLIQAGTNWIQSQGDKAQLETVKKKITYAFIGLMVTLSVYAILKIVGTVTGITGLENLQITLPTL